jgi:hypothetical protein
MLEGSTSDHKAVTGCSCSWLYAAKRVAAESGVNNAVDRMTGVCVCAVVLQKSWLCGWPMRLADAVLD